MTPSWQWQANAFGPLALITSRILTARFSLCCSCTRSSSSALAVSGAGAASVGGRMNVYGINSCAADLADPYRNFYTQLSCSQACTAPSGTRQPGSNNQCLRVSRLAFTSLSCGRSDYSIAKTQTRAFVQSATHATCATILHQQRRQRHAQASIAGDPGGGQRLHSAQGLAVAFAPVMLIEHYCYVSPRSSTRTSQLLLSLEFACRRSCAV